MGTGWLCNISFRPGVGCPALNSRTGTASLVGPTGCMADRSIQHRSGACYFALGPKAAKVGGLLLLLLPSVLFRFLFSVFGSDIPSPDLSALEHLFIVYVLGDFLLFWLVLGAISGWMFQSSVDLRTALEATWSEGRLRT